MSIIIPNPPGGGNAVGSSAAEIVVQRRLTDAFIQTQPVFLTLIPRLKVKQPAGGFKWQEQVARQPQTMRLVESSQIPRPVVTADGIQREIEMMLLGAWDANIGMFDIFNYDQRDWEIVSLAHFNGWEQRAQVARYG